MYTVYMYYDTKFTVIIGSLRTIFPKMHGITYQIQLLGFQNLFQMFSGDLSSLGIYRQIE